jgi:hypothetical protein
MAALAVLREATALPGTGEPPPRIDGAKIPLINISYRE